MKLPSRKMTQEELEDYQEILAVMVADLKRRNTDPHVVARAFAAVGIHFCVECENTYEIEGFGGRKVRCPHCWERKK